jgi:hypothetical protein
LLDRENEEELLRMNFHKFQRLYQPLMQSTFKDCFQIDSAGKFIIDHHHQPTSKFLMSHLNDNVF